MEKTKEKQIAMAAGARGTKHAKLVVGRLLTPLELDHVAGGWGTCGSGGQTHNMGSGGNYTQSGGQFDQTGGTYNMKCSPNGGVGGA